MINLSGKNILLVTKHGKEEAIAPVFKAAFNANIDVVSGFDTDQFGMFSGEIKREKSSKETVLDKCKSGLKLNPEYDYAIASEGSFGNHPDSVYLPYNEEWLVFVDKSNSEFVYAKNGTTETNFISQEISSAEELERFFNRFEPAKFIVKSYEDQKVILKGVSSQEEVSQTLQNYGKITLETDVRAMNNPLRMKNIAKAAENLVAALQSNCPNCGKAGFTVKKSIPGLPCEVCNFPSNYPKNHGKVCDHCGEEEIVEAVHQQKYLDPQYCQICNP